MRRIDAFDIESRIGFGVSQPLRLRQHVGEICAGVFHGREDVIASAVENAIDAFERIGGRAFAQALYHRNAAGDRSFELERGLGRFGRTGQFQPVMRDHRLVRGDQRLAVGDRVACQRQRRSVRSAHKLHHHIDIIAHGERIGIVDPFISRQVDAAVLGAVTRANRGDPDRTPRPACDQGRVRLDQADHTGAHGAETGKGNVERFWHGAPFRERPLIEADAKRQRLRCHNEGLRARLQTPSSPRTMR